MPLSDTQLAAMAKAKALGHPARLAILRGRWQSAPASAARSWMCSPCRNRPSPST